MLYLKDINFKIPKKFNVVQCIEKKRLNFPKRTVLYFASTIYIFLISNPKALCALLKTTIIKNIRL